MFPQRRNLLALSLSLAVAAPLLAQDKFPAKPVTIIVPHAAGGANDTIARVIAQKLSEQTGQSFVVDNRTGAGGNVGTVAAARARADGYTLFIAGVGNFAINVSLFRKLPYDPQRDFAPVALLAIQPFALAVHPSLPANNL